MSKPKDIIDSFVMSNIHGECTCKTCQAVPRDKGGNAYCRFGHEDCSTPSNCYCKCHRRSHKMKPIPGTRFIAEKATFLAEDGKWVLLENVAIEQLEPEPTKHNTREDNHEDN